MIEYLPTLYQQQIAKSKYARWNEPARRREHWPETVDRYIAAIQKQTEKHDYTLTEEEVAELRLAILNLEVMPSMRALMTAGTALDRDNMASFNCAALAVDRPQAFDEALYILCCGTGVGFSVENKFVSQLPPIPTVLYPSETTIVVRDSKIGWASALRQLIHLLYSGVIPNWDVSKVRPAGARLKTFGGRASGPGPLIDLFNYVIQVFQGAQGRKLNSIECHGIMCKVGDIVVVGGVRRSALISLSDPTDDRMRDAKAGQWWTDHPEYALANNSAIWNEKPSMERFMEEWSALIRSKSGERGIVNRQGLRQKAAQNGRRDIGHDFLLNPCAEIILRSRGLCNLSEVVVRTEDTKDDIIRKIRLAAIVGTIQSTYTDFRYVSAAWKKNAEEERLLGVSLTGVMDHPILSGQVEDENFPLAELLAEFRQVAVDVNAIWAPKLGISPSVAVTCVKPSGTVSQLVDSASGMHARYADYYVRTNRMSKHDPVAQLLYMQGVPCEDEVLHPDTTWVFSYPQKAPASAVTRDQMSAIEQLELWLVYAEHWCEHKPSVTVYVHEDEWLSVGAFVFKHFAQMSGVSFLPHSDHTYQQAPYQEITEDEYNDLTSAMPHSIDWDLLSVYEKEDTTEGVKELACTAGSCELV